MRHPLPVILGAAALAALIAAVLLSPVRVRLRARARNDTLLRPRVDVFLLWGLVHLRPRVDLPRHPLRELAERLGIPLGGPPRQGSGAQGTRRRTHARSGGASSVSRHAAHGLQHAASGTAAGHYLFGMTQAVAVRRLHLTLAFHTGDPARTAIAAGVAWGLLGASIAGLAAYLRFERPPRLRVEPLFAGAPRIRASLDCILAARLGHVMVAALRSYLQAASATKRGDAA